MDNSIDIEVMQIKLLSEAAELYMRQCPVLNESADIQVLNESVSDTIKKMIERLKELIRKIVAKIRDLCNKFLGTSSYTPEEIEAIIKDAESRGKDEGKSQMIEKWNKVTKVNRPVKARIDLSKIDKFINECERHLSRLNDLSYEYDDADDHEDTISKIEKECQEFHFFWGEIYGSGDNKFECNTSYYEVLKLVNKLRPLADRSTDALEDVRKIAASMTGIMDSRKNNVDYNMERVRTSDDEEFNDRKKRELRRSQKDYFLTTLVRKYADCAQLINACCDTVDETLRHLKTECIREFKKEIGITK